VRPGELGLDALAAFPPHCLAPAGVVEERFDRVGEVLVVARPRIHRRSVGRNRDSLRSNATIGRDIAMYSAILIIVEASL
jgi:hypothetical protein